MDKIRLGIIGFGGMGQAHAANLLAGKVARCELVAACDAVEANLKKFPQLRGFATPEELFAAKCVDAVLIATPHFAHTSLGIAGLEAGLHVLVEKPISVHRADAERLIAAHKNPRQVFGGMFNQRTDPYYQAIRRLVQGGELGTIRRVNWTITNWYRTHAYYGMGGWRATWKGEGGGVLLNQCPHNLDLFQWIFGMPSRITGFCSFGRYHDIEVEDDVTAYFEYPDGAHASFITSTGEAPGTNRLEIAAERGRLVYEDDKLTFTRKSFPKLPGAEASVELPDVLGKYEPEDAASSPVGPGEIIVREGKLVLKIDGQPDFELTVDKDLKISASNFPDGVSAKFGADKDGKIIKIIAATSAGEIVFIRKTFVKQSAAKTEDPKLARLKALEGTYTAEMAGLPVVKISVRDGKLVIEPEGQNPVSDAKLSDKDELTGAGLPEGFTVTIQRDKDGKVTGMLVKTPMGDAVFTRKPAA